MLYKRGKFYWLDIRIKGKRRRRSLHTSNKLEALSRYAEKKEEIIKEFAEGKVRFDDFCKTYLDWAWSSKPASALHEEQRLEKIKDFFQSVDLAYLSDITPYHIEQPKAYLKTKIEGRGGNTDPSKATINRHLQILRGMFYRAQDWEVYKGPNPLRKIKFYKESSIKEMISWKQLEKIVETVKQITGILGLLFKRFSMI